MFIFLKGYAGIKQVAKAAHDATLGKCISSISRDFNIHLQLDWSVGFSHC